MTNGTRRKWGVSVTPRPLFIPGKDPVPIAQEAGWAPGPVWIGAENLAPPGFDPRTVQPVASHYTDWATRPTKGNRIVDILRYTVHRIYQGGLYFLNITRLDSTPKQVISFIFVRIAWLSLLRCSWNSRSHNSIMFGSLLPNFTQTGPQNSKVRTEIPLRIHEQPVSHYSSFL